MSDLWHQLAAQAEITLAAEQVDRLSRFIDLLLEANQRMNLTRIDTREAAEIGHVGDALTLLPFLPKTSFRLADVGSGGGVPGIPLAIARPDARVVLIESTLKKARFLEETVQQLDLKNVRVAAIRAEDEARGDNRASYDIVTARAVGAMGSLVQWCLPLVKPGGKLLAMKGAKITEELPLALPVIRRLGGANPIVHPVALPGAEHHVVVEVSVARSGKASKKRRP